MVRSLLFILILIGFMNCHPQVKNRDMNTLVTNVNTDTATIGGGCFWCTEAIYQQVVGVVKVESGYSGGTVKNPSYHEVCIGKTGHAEVVQIVFDPLKITFNEVLQIFFLTHDPTVLNRQGNDEGTQYRSVIFYRTDDQKGTAEKVIKEVNQSGNYQNPVVTEITPFKAFYKAEGYHQNYYKENGDQAYCRFVIAPKLEKFRKTFASKLKSE
jgi:peptide-methionine (S)-S-oxide reductase